MQINEFGRNLNIVCLCDLKVSHGWGSFSFWRSVEKQLPEAKFVIACKRGMGHPKAFSWTYKVDVPLVYFTDQNKLNFNNSLVLSPYTIASRTYDADFLKISSKSNELSTFITYLDGVGSFVIDERIDIIEPPFGAATDAYYALDMTVNELIVLKHWEQMDKFLELY